MGCVDHQRKDVTECHVEEWPHTSVDQSGQNAQVKQSVVLGTHFEQFAKNSVKFFLWNLLLLVFLLKVILSFYLFSGFNFILFVFEVHLFALMAAISQLALD